MVTRISNGVDFNLDTIADNYGVENDFIYIIAMNSNDYATWAGNDVIDASKASPGSFINEMYSGLGDDFVAGSSGSDWIYDGAGNDAVLGGLGADRIHVDLGNDTYYGGGGTDMVDFRYLNVLGPLFSDSYTEGVNFDLAKTSVQNLGVRGFDQFFGFENINGSLANDVLYGDASSNEITGNDGRDALDGRAGVDTLTGGQGADTLIGGAGGDRIDLAELLPARDVVKYLARTESGTTASARDTIINFDKGGGATDDKIDLSRIDADAAKAGNQAFLFKGAGAFNSAAGEVRLIVQGIFTLVYVDTDADAAAEMIINVQGVTGLTKADFVL